MELELGKHMPFTRPRKKCNSYFDYSRYSTPNTLLDKSSMVKKGFKGDASVMKPTIMAAVPLILERVYKTIKDTLAKRGPGFEKLFNFCYKYRLEANLRGEHTPIMDFLVFRSLRALFGGRIRVMCAGEKTFGKCSIELSHAVIILFS